MRRDIPTIDWRTCHTDRRRTALGGESASGRFYEEKIDLES